MATSSQRNLRIALWAEGAVGQWQSTIVSLRTAMPGVDVLLGGPDAALRRELGSLCDQTLGAHDLAGLVHTAADGGAHVLVVHAPCTVPAKLLERARALVDEDLRCASVSFLSPASGLASFTPRAVPSALGAASDVTTALRNLPHGLAPVTAPYPVGPAVLLSAQGLSLLSPFPSHTPRAPLALADYGAAGRARGLLDLVDPTTFLVTPPQSAASLTAEEARWLRAAHPALAEAVDAASERTGALNEAMALVRASIEGLRILVDGYCLLPEEMGTQVAFLAMLRALANRREIAYLGVALPGFMPEYAREVLGHPKIDARQSDLATLEGFEDIDVIHRPYQLDTSLDMSRWRSVGRRIAVTVHDLIAYQIPTYHSTPDAWFAHRHVTRALSRQVDGLVAISEDTRDQILRERLSAEEGRVLVVPNGVGHLNGDETAIEPAALRASGFAGEAFVLVLGTNYSHKNRDLAIDVVRSLQGRGHEVHLVMAGANVPYGSSSEVEAGRMRPDDLVHIIPDVTSEERNWLLRHAAVVLYPTGAEGFGLVPHEAAAFGTPTVMVPIPALAERFASLPVLAADWSLEALTEATSALLSDPALAGAQVRAINAVLSGYSWENSASTLLASFRSLLAQPAVGTL